MTGIGEEKFSDCENIKQRLIYIRIGDAVCKDAPKVSVIIPAYKVSMFIEETLNSVLNQRYQNYEIILVNDGSPDTQELENTLNPYFDKIIYAKQENLGAAQARNSAICLSRGKLLAFLDGDDIWLPDYLESQVSLLEKEGLDMIYCDAWLFGNPLNEAERFSDKAPSNGEFTSKSLIEGKCNVITSGTVVKKSKLVEFNMFDTKTLRTEDFDLWFRLAKNNVKIGYQKGILLKYRVRIDGLSGTNVARTLRTIAAFKLINDKYQLSPTEKDAWHKQMELCQAEYELEQGKFYLTQRDFIKARKHFVKANKFYRKRKLQFIVLLLIINPKLALNLFKKLRSAEFSFISPEN